MCAKNRTTDAADILYRRYIKGDAEREQSVQEERINAQVASLIYELRTEAGLSQKELAERVGTTQSVISRLEDADYRGHSLSMVNRIARALRKQVTISVTDADENVNAMHVTHDV